MSLKAYINWIFYLNIYIYIYFCQNNFWVFMHKDLINIYTHTPHAKDFDSFSLLVPFWRLLCAIDWFTSEFLGSRKKFRGYWTSKMHEPKHFDHSINDECHPKKCASKFWRKDRGEYFTGTSVLSSSSFVGEK